MLSDKEIKRQIKESNKVHREWDRNQKKAGNPVEKLLKKYQDRLVVLNDNKRFDKTSGYPYDHEIKCVDEFIRDLKKLNNPIIGI